MRWMTTFLLLTLVAACNGEGDDKTGAEDLDGDGYDTTEDCDDGNADVHPDADEVCDEVDNDCDGDVDEDAVDGTTFYADADGDLFGDPNSAKVACSATEGFVEDNTDCDDSNESIHPNGQEICDELMADEDCDGASDDEDESTDPDTMSDWYTDADGDGFGDELAEAIAACHDPGDGDRSYALDNTDCDDARNDVNPGADEVCDDLDTDEDCDGLSENDDDDNDPTTQTWYYLDADKDTFGDLTDTGSLFCDDPSTLDTEYSADHTDCDDSRADVNPDADEVCDDADVDEDCDGFADDLDEDALPSTMTTYHVDADQDGFGVIGTGTLYCDDPSTSSDKWSLDNTDCDDTEKSVNPGMTERCDAMDVDEDCNGVADNDDSGADASTKTTYYVDGDQDKYGAKTDTGTDYCDDPSTASDWWSLNNTDCDDAVATTYPTATETIGDGVDSDCDGGEICFVDADNDAYIVSSGATIASSDEDCEDAGEGTNLDKTGDCDDGDGAINPGATEVCDASNVDENCNGRADDADSTTDASTKTDYYQDSDKDRYGDMSGTASAYCDDPSTTSDWWTSDHTDCDDRDSSIYPGASETIGDSVDSDCDGGEICFVDGDDDGYRTTTTVTSTDEDCLDAGEGEVGDPAGDCNDGNAEINPGAVEKCDGLDNDCDASTSEDGSSWMTWTDSSGSPASSHFPASSWSSSYSESSPWEFTVSSSYSDLVMTFCKGTYPVNLTFAVDVDIRGRTGTASDVIFSGGSTSKAVFSIITNNIDLSAENVTIQNGDGVNGFQSKADSGGGIYCNSTGLSSTLTLDNVVMKDNVAGGARGSGAALASDGCAVTMTDSIIRDNTSVNGALAIADAPLNLDNVDFYDNDGAYISGAYLYSDVVATTATLRDVTFSRNDTTDTSKSWGALHADGDTSGSIITLNLIDTLFEHNTAAATAAVTSTQPNGSGLYVSQFVEVFWDADTATSVGALDNDLNGVVLFGLMATLDAVDVDLGIAGSSDDNDLADVATSRSLYRANNNRDFICDRESCSNDARNPDGDPTNDEYVCDIGATTLNTSGDNRFRGNVIRADRNSTLESVDAFLDVDSSCDLDFYVMERSGTSGAWTVLFSRINAPRTTVGAGWQNSGHIGVPVTSGKYYLIFTAWNCPTTSQTVRYYFHNTPGNPGFGSFSTNVLSSGTYGSSTAYAEGNSYTLSFNAYSGSTADRYKARYNLNDLETTSTADCIP